MQYSFGLKKNYAQFHNCQEAESKNTILKIDSSINKIEKKKKMFNWLKQKTHIPNV